LLYRAVLVLTGKRLTPRRFRVARHALLEDLEIYDDPRQGAGSWIFENEQRPLERLGEELDGTAETGAYADAQSNVQAAANDLRAALEANGT